MLGIRFSMSKRYDSPGSKGEIVLLYHIGNLLSRGFKKFFYIFPLRNILTVEQEPVVQAQSGKGTGRVEERTPSAGAAARALTAALWAVFRWEEPFPA